MVYSNILDAMGNTPTIQLNHMVPDGCARVLVKFEGLNVGGSIKTRTAVSYTHLRGTTMMTLRRVEKKIACFDFPRATKVNCPEN